MPAKPKKSGRRSQPRERDSSPEPEDFLGFPRASQQKRTNELLETLVAGMTAQKDLLGQLVANNTAQAAGTPSAQAVGAQSQAITVAQPQPQLVTPGTHSTMPQVRQPDPVKPPSLQVNPTLEQFDSWMATFNDYASCFNFDQLPLHQQTARLRCFLSTEMRSELIHGVGILDTDLISPSDILGRIRDYLRNRTNIAIDRVRFEERRQETGESFDEFYVSLRKIAGNADLCDKCFDTRLATRVMVGISDAETRKKLLAKKPFPTLQEVVDLCRSEECARKNEAVLEKKSSGASSRSINKASSQGGKRDSNAPQKNDKKSSEKKKQCRGCGSDWHKERKDCPAFQHRCAKCGKTGHFAKRCENADKKESQQKESKVQKVQIRISTTQSKSPEAPKVQISLYHGIAGDWMGDLTATPDTGAESTVAGLDAMQELGLCEEDLLDAENTSLLTADGKKIKCVGSVKFQIRYKGRRTSDMVYFCRGIRGVLIPWYVCVDLGILHKEYPEPINDPDDTHQISQVSLIQKVSLLDIEKVLGKVPDEPNEKQRATIQEKLITEFKDVFDSSSTLKPMACPPMKIALRKDAVPYCQRVPRQIPLAWRDKVKAEIDKMEEQQVVSKLGDDETTEWCHPMVCVPKPDGGVRPCVDLTKLNPFVIRPLHPFKAPWDAISEIPNSAKYFTVLDATKGYWQLLLEEESQPLTVFITPWGRYKFLRAPMGLASTGDEYCRQGDKALLDLGNITKVVDDTLEFDDCFRDHIVRVWNTLLRCRERGITLNAKKLQFALPEVKFVGFRVGVDGVKADSNKLKAIQEFPTPKNLTELRSFFGIVNQLAEFTADIAKAAEPLRPLLRTKNVFMWSPDHDRAFEEVKKALVSTPVLAKFDITLDTVLETDASRKGGLGFVLKQRHGSKWRIVQCGSRFLTDTETRYAVIELELLAVVYAVRKCRLYLQGLPKFDLVTDHKPLVPIINDYTLADIENPRLLRLKEKLAGYVVQARWIKGKDHIIPDALSRAPVDQPSQDDVDLEAEISSVSSSICAIAAEEIDDTADTDITLDAIKKVAKDDPTYQELIREIEKGFPKGWQKRSPATLPYRRVRHELSQENGLVLYGSRIVIPETARRLILAHLHSPHQGIEKSKRRARQCVYWPRMDVDITNNVQGCKFCQERLPSLAKEPLISDPPPQWVFQEVSADLFSYAGKSYLVYVDRLSGWPIVHSFGRDTPSANQVLRKFRQNFVDYGVPVKVRTDNGPQFSASEFRKFLERWGVNHCPSSPHYPQSNGRAECAVKAMKALVAKSTVNGNLDTEPYDEGLLEFRNTPLANGKSPAELLFGHPTRTLLSMLHSNFAPEWTEKREEAETKSFQLRKYAEDYYNRSAAPLKPLKVGQSVCIQDPDTKKWNKVGDIVGVNRHRDYHVKLPGGRVYWRNRRFLRPNFAVTQEEDQEKEEPPSTSKQVRSRKQTVFFRA